MSPAQFPVQWARGYLSRAGAASTIQSAVYSLKKLVNDGYISRRDENGLLVDSALSDIVFEVTWASDNDTPDEELEERLSNVDGYVIFVHGWTGNHTIFEELPGMLVSANRRLVAISIDHNGFGQSTFVSDPQVETCNPPAAMRTLERWVNALKIRRQPGDRSFKTINFVGHSMGGATLFYANPIQWNYGELTRYALAPALLLEDEVKQAFYRGLGLAIDLVNRIPAFEIIERFVKPQIISTLCGGSSEYIKYTHDLQYGETPRSTTATTLTAMGVLRDWEIPRNFDLFRVMLSHRDALVGLTPMVDLVCKLEFPVSHLRVVPGSHYMFSVGLDSAYQHAQNRELVVEDILLLHEHALDMQKTGKRFG